VKLANILNIGLARRLSGRSLVTYSAAAPRFYGGLGNAVRQLKEMPGRGLYVGGVKLPLALAELGLIDEYKFVVHPRLVGQGPTLFAGLSRRLDLKLISRLEFGSGAVAMRYEPGRSPVG
jgi:dihydrofolate reductase